MRYFFIKNIFYIHFGNGFVYSCNYLKLVNKFPALLFSFVKQKKCFLSLF